MSNYPNRRLGAETNKYEEQMQILRSFLFTSLCTCQPVEVVNVNNRFVDVKPVLMNRTTTGEQIPITDKDIIHNIPMMTLFGNGCEISLNMAQGDKGLLIASKFDIANYKKTQAPSVVGSSRVFNWSDGFFLPLDFKTKQEGVTIRNQDTIINLLPTSVNITTTNLTVTAQQAEINADTATINAGSVNLGGSGGKGVARIDDQVQVEVTSGSSAGTWTGKIISGSGVTTSI